MFFIRRVEAYIQNEAEAESYALRDDNNYLLELSCVLLHNAMVQKIKGLCFVNNKIRGSPCSKWFNAKLTYGSQPMAQIMTTNFLTSVMN